MLLYLKTLLLTIRTKKIYPEIANMFCLFVIFSILLITTVLLCSESMTEFLIFGEKKKLILEYFVFKYIPQIG